MSTVKVIICREVKATDRLVGLLLRIYERRYVIG